MKLRPIPVETTNPFAEAALGDQMPGQGGVGSATAVDTAWNKAVQSVQGEGTSGQSSQDGTGEQAPEGEIAGTETLVAPTMNTGEPQTQQSGPTWDRLSMTVASMVAWNLQAESAPDQHADLIDGEVWVDPSLNVQVAAIAATGEPTNTQLGETPVDVAMVSGLATSLQVENDTDASASKGALTDEMLSATALKKSDLQANQSAGSQIGQEAGPAASDATTNTETNIEIPTTLREGNVAHSPGQEVQVAPTEVQSSRSAMVGVGQQLGTEATNGLPNVSTTPTSTVIPEIPTPSLDSSATATQAVQGQSLDAKGENPDPMQLVKDVRVRSEAKVAPTTNVDVDRLQGLRAALAELDTDTLNRMQSARLEQGSRMRIRMATKAANHDLTHMVEQVQVRKARIPDAYIQKQLAGAMANTQMSKPQNVNPDQQVVGHMTADADGPEFQETLASKPSQSSSAPKMSSRPLVGDLMRMGQGTSMGQGAQTEQLIEGNSSAVNHAAIVGEDTAQIEADTMRVDEWANVDAETIDAMEIPELPINDPSQIDIDIEDPAGTVRLDLSRTANEVAIQIETPNEVLEEYRDMEEDIDAALAEHGLDLESFNAEAGDGDSKSEDSDKENSKSDNANPTEPGNAPLENAGERGRILNMIV